MLNAEGTMPGLSKEAEAGHFMDNERICRIDIVMCHSARPRIKVIDERQQETGDRTCKRLCHMKGVVISATVSRNWSKTEFVEVDSLSI